MTTPTPAQLFSMSPCERLASIKQLIPARHLDLLADRMKTSKNSLVDTLSLSRSSINAKIRTDKKMTVGESELVLGVEYLIGQVQTMVGRSGDPNGFDSAVWFSTWMRRPLPALAGATPAAYMDCIEGQKMISQLLAITESGAYA